MAELLRSTPGMEKKYMEKAAKPSKQLTRKSLIQIEWDGRDRGKGKLLKKAVMCCCNEIRTVTGSLPRQLNPH